MKRIADCFVLPLAGVAVSLIAGALVLELFGRLLPDVTLKLFRWAADSLETITTGVGPTRYDGLGRALIDERLIVYMAFVVAVRLLLSLVLTPLCARAGDRS